MRTLYDLYDLYDLCHPALACGASSNILLCIFVHTDGLAESAVVGSTKMLLFMPLFSDFTCATTLYFSHSFAAGHNTSDIKFRSHAVKVTGRCDRVQLTKA